MRREWLRCRVAGAVALAVGLLSAAGASGALGDSYTASSAPTDVKPSTATTFTIQLKNDAASPNRADRARIGIATGFVVDAPSVTALTSAAGTCVVSTWVADGALIADGRINLRRPAGGPPNELCPGAVLTVTFTATAPASDSVGAWTTELLRTDAFALVGNQPGVKVDGTAPTTTITSAPSSQTNSRSASIAFGSAEAGATFECRLDAAAFAACTSPTVLNDLGDGPHTFRVRATDRAGNVDTTPASHTWTVETRAPTTTITSGPPVLAASASAAFGLAADEPVARFECRLDAAPSFTACPATVTYAQLAQGSHTFRARGVDVAGNVGPETTRTWTIDTIPPETAITSQPPPTIDRGDATFDFVATEPASRFECALDGAAFASCASPLVLTELPDGLHTLRVRSWDVAGNVDSSPATYAWTVSRPAPAPPAEPDRVPPSQVRGASARAGDGRVTVRWTPPADPDFERVVVVRISPGKSVRNKTVYEGAGTAVVDRGLMNGVRYRYRITTRDRTGNSSVGVEVVATPQAPLIAPRNGASVSAPPVLLWQPTPRATYYNVQLWLVRAGGQQQAARPVKVLSAWPSTPRLKLSTRWVFGGKRYRLVPGSYRWFVFPGLGKRSQARYGALVGQSAFTVKGRKAL